MSKAYYEVTPCKGCEKRVVGCHSTCDEYNKWKKSGIEIFEMFVEYDTKRKRRLRRR